MSFTRRQALMGSAVAAAAWPLAVPAAPERRLGGALFKPWPAATPTPALTLPLHEGGRWSLAEQQGRVLVLNFWATWCEPCREELPALELLDTRLAEQGLRVVTVNFQEPSSRIDQFLRVWPMSLPILRDDSGQVSRAWGVRAFPTTVLVNRQGRADSVLMGALDAQSPDLLAYLQTLLKPNAPKTA